MCLQRAATAGGGSRRPGGRARRRFMEALKEWMKTVGLGVEGAEDRVRWRQMIGCDPPRGEKKK